MVTRVLYLFLLASLSFAAGYSSSVSRPFYDRTFPSRVFGQERNYRIFLPPDYDSSGVRYPVIYYFHGHSDRYTLEKYDNGKDTVPKIARFVEANPVIVVTVDGYVAEHYQGFYGGDPWDVRKDGGKYDFGEYFKELFAYIDAHYRTKTGRRFRATSGLSMGGFMSLYLSARYPDLIGSASAFNPGPEFFTGDPGRRVLWRPKDHVSSHNHSMVRLIRASGDFISQYTEETRDAYARAAEVDFEYRQDEYHRHWATSIGETFAFHMRAFDRSSLSNVPEVFDYANAYRKFDVWGYDVTAEGDAPGYNYLEGVRQGGMRIRTRQWAPDGPPVADRTITVTTAPLYKAGHAYWMIDHNLSTGETATSEVTAGENGRLRFTVDGDGHQVSFAGPGTSGLPPLLLRDTKRDTLIVEPDRDVPLPVRIYNPRGEALKDVTVRVSSEYPTVRLLAEEAKISSIEPGAYADLSQQLKARFTAGAGYFDPARIDLRITYDGWLGASDRFLLLLVPEIVPAPEAVEILDGRTMTFGVFRQKGNQGGGSSIERTVTEGKGNGNGRLEPGEEATVWVKMRQGMDPFDKNNWHRTKVYAGSRWIKVVGDIQETKQREFTGAQERTSVIKLAGDVPGGTTIPLLLENETWSLHFTPDVRYGRERLYQAIQLHRRHLHRLTINVP